MLVIAADMGKEKKSLSNKEIKEISMEVVVSVGVVSKIHQQIPDLHAKNRTSRKRILSPETPKPNINTSQPSPLYLKEKCLPKI